MKDEMFFGKPPAFDDLINAVREFQDAFNRKARHVKARSGLN